MKNYIRINIDADLSNLPHSDARDLWSKTIADILRNNGLDEINKSCWVFCMIRNPSNKILKRDALFSQIWLGESWDIKLNIQLKLIIAQIRNLAYDTYSVSTEAPKYSLHQVKERLHELISSYETQILKSPEYKNGFQSKITDITYIGDELDVIIETWLEIFEVVDFGTDAEVFSTSLLRMKDWSLGNKLHASLYEPREWEEDFEELSKYSSPSEELEQTEIVDALMPFSWINIESSNIHPHFSKN